MRSNRSFCVFFLLTAATVFAGNPPVWAQTPPNTAKPATRPAVKRAAPKRAATAPTPAPAQASGGAQPTLLGQFGDWGAYKALPDGKPVCFALSKPKSSSTNPPHRPRDPAFLFVSTRPAEKVSNEVSVLIGYPFKPNFEASAEIGSANFAMYTQSDGAWIKNAAEEARMVDAMRKGADLTVKGESSRGTTTADTFALKGLSQALDRIAGECK